MLIDFLSATRPNRTVPGASRGSASASGLKAFLRGKSLQRKKESAASESPVYDTRPSTACSSVSDMSTPPTRNHTPPKQEPLDIGLPPMVSRRHSDQLIQVPIAVKVDDAARLHQLPPGRPNGYPVQANTHTPMISGPGLLDASSQYPSHGSYHDNQVSTHHYASGHSLALPRLPQHPSSQSQRFEPSAQWNTPQMLQAVDPIQPYIHHYCDNSLSLLMALPSENPVLAANLQLVLSRAPNSDLSIEALRNALLGIAATHQSYLLSRGGDSLQAEETMSMANAFRSESKRLLSKSFTTSEGMQSDASLAASVANSLLDILSGGYDWAVNLNIAKTVISRRGGPAVLLARSAKSKTGMITGVTRARLFVEIVSIYDIFGCLATGQIPTLLSPQMHSWWLESANAEDTQSHVEKYFGISRTFIPLFVKVVDLLSRAYAYQISDGRWEGQQKIIENAQTLYRELDEWTDPRDLPPRINAGNHIYRRTAQIALLREVLRLPFDNDLVQSHVDTVLSLCLDCGKQSLSVDLNWPVIIAGSQVVGANRARVLEIFEHFRVQCCYEIETTQHIVSQVRLGDSVVHANLHNGSLIHAVAIAQVWQRLDSNQPGADWRAVMQDLDLNVLLL
ncbi:hypothetical protein NM688_g9180 [Phlebia brevispora]|uniref:Uncharacterized protein n=1 Tax=Phlebia brevispora TaxID=194682 RepID=A0ACC1RJU1_9APHY|nr:hypothetical protein NM688_g9180 [Phlebia brevispora]